MRAVHDPEDGELDDVDVGSAHPLHDERRDADDVGPVSSGGTVSVTKSQVLKAKAVKSGMTDSPVRRADYLITGAVSAGHQHALGLKTDGTVLSWGVNSWGQIGRGAITGAAQSPAAIPSFSNVVAVSAAGDQYRATSLAVKSDGTLWGWGHGGYGKLGNGSTSNQTAPVQVSTITNVVQVAAGIEHTVALTSSGTVWAWGLRTSGALGDGSTSGHATTPQQVSGISNAVAVGAGYQFSVALKSDGMLVAWGRNQEGQLGDGTTTDRTTPVSVPNLTGIAAVSAGAYHTMALQGETGSLWTFGYNFQGELGDGTTVKQTSPIRVRERVTRISGSNEASLALEEDSGFLKAVVGAGDHFGNYGDSSAPATSKRFLRLVRDDYVDLDSGTSIQLALRADTKIREWGTMMSTGANGIALGDTTGVTDDPDSDGLSNADEWALGTDPYDSDTNDDGILDGIAIASGMSATNPDMDGDTVWNWVERAQGTDPFRADTDGDGVSDGADAFPLDPTRTTAPSPNPSDTTPPSIALTEPTNATLISSNP